MSAFIKLFIVLLGISFLLNCSKEEKKSPENLSNNKNNIAGSIRDSVKPDTQKVEDTVIEKKIYSNLDEFWNDFKKYAIEENYTQVALMTYFPFLNHMFSMDEEDFKEFRFSEDILSGMKNKKTPKKSRMSFTDFESGELYEADFDGPKLYFAKVEGEWKFVGILYGE